jgi:CubicO group peptidase (beta-lactamase class C family)
MVTVQAGALGSDLAWTLGRRRQPLLSIAGAAAPRGRESGTLAHTRSGAYRGAMSELRRRVDETAAGTGFAGVVRLEQAGAVVLDAAYGLADRRHGIAMTTDTQLGMASGSKTFTALVVLRLMEEGLLGLSTTARQILGTNLPLIADDVTIEHLLSHRSGIGDYLDEDEFDSEDYELPVSAHRLVTTDDFLPVLDGYPTKFRAGDRFSYCNGAFVVLALIAERVSGRSYHELLRELVCRPRAWPTPGCCAPTLFPAGRHWGMSRSRANGGPTSSICR